MLLQCVCELRKGGELINVKGALSLSVGTHGTEPVTVQNIQYNNKLVGITLISIK